MRRFSKGMGQDLPQRRGRECLLDHLLDCGFNVLDCGEEIILSVGGGTSPGMPKQNIVAMMEALREFNKRR